jgi:malonate-semialdehyde dehydrogenase (acetylating)/methylmalonate-semialdehyde dehydrogenase
MKNTHRMNDEVPDPASNAPLESVPHWIDGQSQAGSARFAAVYNPTLGRIARRVPLASTNDVDKVVASAAKAYRGWSRLTALRRARVMFKFKELLDTHARRLAQIISDEHGKTIDDALGEVTRGIEVVEFACGAPHLLKGEFSDSVGTGVDSYNMRLPLGVVAGVTPFNFPAMVPLWMIPLALVCGNTFVLKPSERDPSASLLIAKLLKEAGLPDGVLSVIHGDKECVDALLDHQQIAAISFVGSTPVARHLQQRAVAAGKRVQALGGAKNHMVVMPDADLDAAAEALIGAAFGSAGERCMAISVVVAVGDSTAEALIQRLRVRMAEMRIGGGHATDVDMGPLVTSQHLARVRDYIDVGVREGALLLVDGREHPVCRSDGYFLGPTLFDGVHDGMRIYREEIFGPVLSLVRVNDYQPAVDLINAHEFANGVAVFTRSGAVARNFVADIEVGMVGVNVPLPVPMAFHSFGGWRGSLFGDHSVYGMEGIRFYTRLKTVTERWPGQEGARAEFVMPTML